MLFLLNSKKWERLKPHSYVVLEVLSINQWQRACKCAKNVNLGVLDTHLRNSDMTLSDNYAMMVVMHIEVIWVNVQKVWHLSCIAIIKYVRKFPRPVLVPTKMIIITSIRLLWTRQEHATSPLHIWKIVYTRLFDNKSKGEITLYHFKLYLRLHFAP